jgi:sucrose-6-phosphate hydrolase SacC (GH32 family)
MSIYKLEKTMPLSIAGPTAAPSRTICCSLLAVLALVAAVPQSSGASPRARADILIADFEGTSYPTGWTTTGTAFGSGPASGTLANQMQTSGFQGSGLVNSFNGGDASTGSLTSRPFIVGRHFIRFLIGGGNQRDREGINLLVNGVAVRTATGQDDEHLLPEEWDVSNLEGKTAQLQVVDTATGGWGHVLVDDIIETDRPLDYTSDPISAAMSGVLKAIPVAAADPTRPVYHFHAPAQWMNDPNGFIYFGGWYHIFYQSNPYSSDWGNMHWGHARSRDLLNWQQLPIALWPSHERGEEHVFSGSLFRDAAGRPMAFYTSIAAPGAPRDPEIWAAKPVTSSLLRWRKLDSEPVISEHNYGAVHIDEWRDPFLFTHNGETYLVSGGELDGRGVVCLFQASNGQLTSWKYKGILFQYPDPSVKNIECPNFFRIGQQWVLLISVNSHIEYFTGNTDFDRGLFTPKAHGVLEEGSYASQLTQDDRGRTIELAWVRPIGGKGWSGCVTLPNLLSVDPDGALIATPSESIQTLRGSNVTLKQVELTGTSDLTSRISGTDLEIDARITPGTATEVGIRLRVSADGTRAVVIRYTPATHVLSAPGFKDMVVAQDPASGALDLHIYLDRALLDIYGNGGRVSETGAPVPASAPGDVGVQLYATGGTATLDSVAIYRLNAAKFDLSLYH